MTGVERAISIDLFQAMALGFTVLAALIVAGFIIANAYRRDNPRNPSDLET